MLAELRRVAEDGVTEAELGKAKNIMLADYWRSLATIDGKAGALGDFEVFYGGYEKLFEHPEAIAAISADDLKAAAGFFTVNNMTVGVLQAAPEDLPE